MSSFQDFSFFLVHKNPEAEAQWSSAQAALNYKTEREREHTHTSFWPLPHGYCERKDDI